MKGLERLRAIQKLSKKNPKWKHKELFRILRNEDIWITAYNNIKKNRGAFTSRIQRKTFDGTTISKLRKVQRNVLDENYSFQHINKTSETKQAIPTSNDILVQEVMRLVLEAIYKPIFDHRSFGFQNNKEVHDALAYVEEQFRWVDWVIAGHIRMDPKRVCEILRKRIDDERFMNLIRKALKESIVFPILVNIYFTELDEWLTDKAKFIYKEKSAKWSPEYKKLEDQISQIRRASKEHYKLVRNLDKEPELHYTRYADNWIIGIKGPRKLAEQIKDEIDLFLCQHLYQQLESEKIKITNLRAGKIRFLGYEIFIPRNTKLGNYNKTGEIYKSTPRLKFHLPINKVVQCLKKLGYITYVGNKIRPISKSNYTTLKDEIIVNHYKSVWLSLSNFYSGVTNLSHLQYIHYLLHTSCAMSLAHRHRLSTKKIFKKFGKRLEILDKTSKHPKIIAFFPYRKNWKVSNRNWQYGKVWNDPFLLSILA